MISITNFSIFILLSSLSQMATAGSEESEMRIPSVAEYFNNLKDDMTKVTWAHAVNNQTLLKKYLEDSDVMMLEADVVLGNVVGKKEIIPIMAHPPAKESDLSLKMFMNEVIGAQSKEKKGVKLDFKTTNAFVEAMAILTDIQRQLNFPVWLNADILRGPVESGTTPVDMDRFLGLSVEKFPSATLSLGWTTKYAPGMRGYYTEKQLNEMIMAIEKHNVKQTVTLAVRAGIVANSSPGIINLVEKIDKFQNGNETSLTIWMSVSTDPVDIAELKNLILRLGKSRTFLDVPEWVRRQLDLDDTSGKTPVTGAMGALVAVLTSVSALFTNTFKLFD